MNDMPMTIPHNDFVGWAIVIAGTLATLWTIGATIYWLIRPGETSPDHPKRLIMRKDR